MKTQLKFILLFIALIITNINAADLSVESHKSFMKSFKEKYFMKAQKELRDGYIVDTYKEYVRQEWQNGNWINEFFEIAEIDTTGEYWIWTSTEHIWDNGAWLKDHKFVVITTPMLGDDPKFISSYSYVWTSNEWAALSRINYQYEGANLKEALIEIAIDVNVFFPFQKYFYTYDQFNQLTSETVFDYESDWIPSAKKVLNYDNSGNMVDLLESNWRESAWLDTLHTTLAYDGLGLLQETIESYFENRNEVPMKKTVFGYGNLGQTTLIKSYLWSEQVWEEVQRDNYQYNINDLLESVLVEVRFANSFTPSIKYLYSYDAMNREVEMLEQNHNGNVWVNHNKISTSYSPTSAHDENVSIAGFELYQNYPNPFNPSTTIKFTIPNVETLRATSLRVMLKVYDILGNEVATLVNGEKEPGVYNSQFSILNSQLPSGVYFYKLQVGKYIQTKKMTLLK